MFGFVVTLTRRRRGSQNIVYGYIKTLISSPLIWITVIQMRGLEINVLTSSCNQHHL